MLKGHLEIELKDTNTGEVTKHEEDNMVTSAIAKLLGLCASSTGGTNNNSSSLSSFLLPLSSKGLGGLLLFDGALEENDNNIHFPTDVTLVGCSGRKANSSSKLIGSYNETESHRNDNGFTSVWDFNTSQANGTIASLALTNYLFADNPFEYLSQENNAYAVNNAYQPVGYDSKNSTIYLYYGGKIYSKKIYSHIIGVNSPIFSSEEEVFNFNFTNPGNGSWTVCNGYDGYIYAINGGNRSNKGLINFKVRKIRLSNSLFIDEGEQTFSVDNVSFSGTNGGSTDFNIKICVCKGYLYFVSYDEKFLYKVNLTNIVDVEELSFGDEMGARYIYPKYSGGVYVDFWYYGLSSNGSKVKYGSYGWVTNDGKAIYNDKSTSESNHYRSLGSYCRFEGDNLLAAKIFSSSSGYAIYYAYIRNYLGTICNLSTPVIKTSAQTMKITYTLTDAV